MGDALRLMPVHIRRNIGGRCRSWGPRGAGWYDPPPVVRCASTFGGYVGGEPIARCTEDMWWRVCVEVCVEVHHA